MRHDSIDVELTRLAFDFFFRFSRFEFALKENGYLTRNKIDELRIHNHESCFFENAWPARGIGMLNGHTVGNDAKPGWDEFVKTCHPNFAITGNSAILLANPPERQIVGIGDALTWKPVGLEDCRSELEKAVRLLKTIRNNPFHGGKHGAEGWDDPNRTRQLLKAGQSILEELV